MGVSSGEQMYNGKRKMKKPIPDESVVIICNGQGFCCEILRTIKNPKVLNLRRRDNRAPQFGDIKEKQWH